MLSRRPRERDPSVVELMDAVGDHLGELLHASAQATEREHLVEELLEARRRNEFLLLATQVLSEVVDYREMVERLAQVSVPVMADLCLIDIVDEDGQMRRMAAWHADPEKRALTEELRTSYPPDPDGVHPAMEVMRSGRSMWSAEVDDDFLRKASRDERHFDILKTLGFTSYVTVPLRLRDEQVLGTVTLVSAGSGRRFSEKDLGLAEQLAEQVSSVVIRARAYDRERRISHELQRHLLPDAIPAIGGWDVAARYRPAAVGVEVGGDWYDVVPISEHLVALVVGDVEGHDLGAARIMSRLRHTLGLLLLEERAPGKALQRLNRVSLAGVGGRLATALVGVLDTRTGSITFSSAGHPSPVRVESGQAVELPVPPGPPLGVQHCHYKDHEFQLDRGCLVMFTDGLVERRGSHLDERLALLEIVAARLPQQRARPGGGLRHRRHDLRRTAAPTTSSCSPPDARRADPGLDLSAGYRSPSRHFASVTACTKEEAVAPLVGAHIPVPCLDGVERPYRDLDCAASTPAMESVADRVTEFLPWYSSVHRGAGYKSRRATAAYEEARDSVHRFARRPAGGDDVVILVRNTTEAINHLAYRLGLGPDDVVATTVVEHHANLLPWARVATRRWVECGTSGTFETADVVRVLDDGRPPALLALTGASNVTGWLPPVEEICAEAHARGVPVLLDAAQLAPHRPLPAGPDFVAFSGHKLYAPFGAGALIGPRRRLRARRPLPGRRRRRRPGRPGRGDLDRSARARGGRLAQRRRCGRLRDGHGRAGADRLGDRRGARGRAGDPALRGLAVHRRRARARAWSESGERDGLAVATFTRGRDAPCPGGGPAERGVRDRRPARLLLRPPLPDPPARRRPRRGGPGAGGRAARRSQRIPGAVRASCGLGTTDDDVDALLDALRPLAAGEPAPVPYVQDDVTGDFWPRGRRRRMERGRTPGGRRLRAGLSAPVRRRWLLAARARRRGPSLAACAHARRRHVRAQRGLGDHRRLGDAAGHGRDAGQPGPSAHRGQGHGRQPALRAGLHARAARTCSS